MTILALEFSSPLRTAAVVREGRVSGRASEEGPSGSRPIALIREALAAAGCDRGSVERIAIGLGPGSFSGVRTAIAIAQGWRLAARVAVVGIPSLEALAETAWRNRVFGRVNLVVDAQRGEFHVVQYEISATGIKLVESLRLAPGSEIEARLATGEVVAGPGISGRFPLGVSIFPDAGVIGLLAADRQSTLAVEELAPLFLRPASFVKAPPPRVVPPA